MSLIEGATEALVVTEHLVNIRVSLPGASGTLRVDYRTNAALLKSVGQRMVIKFKSPPIIELVTATAADISYNIRAVHYGRLHSSEPSDAASIAAIPGSVEIVRSQLLNTNRVAIGHTPAVTDIVKPDPAVGYSPCLDVGWTSLGTDDTSSVTLIIHCIFVASGADLPEYS